MHVLDACHRFRPVGVLNRAFPGRNVARSLAKAFENGDVGKLDAIEEKLLDEAEKAEKRRTKLRKLVKDNIGHLRNNWTAVVNPLRDLPGNRTGAVVQHLGAERRTTLPHTWSDGGLAATLAWRAFTLNGGGLGDYDVCPPAGTCRAQFRQEVERINTRPAGVDFSLFDQSGEQVDRSSGTQQLLYLIGQQGQPVQYQEGGVA